MTTNQIRIAVLASGGGSNFEAICTAIDNGRLNGEVVLCVSDRSAAGVLERARQRDIPCVVFDSKTTRSPADFAAQLIHELQARDTDIVALAGFLKMVPREVVEAYQNRILNIHPALLPAFGGKGMYGKHVHRAAIEHGVKVSGATVHIVDAEYDTGPVVAQRCVSVRDDDTPDSLATRVLEVEHIIYPEALQLFAEGRITLDGRRVRIAEQTSI